MKRTVLNQVFDSSEEDEFIVDEEGIEDDSDGWIQKCEAIKNLDEELAYWDPDNEFQVSRFIFSICYCIL